MWSGNWYGVYHLSVEMETRHWCLQYCEVVAHYVATKYSLIHFLVPPLRLQKKKKKMKKMKKK